MAANDRKRAMRNGQYCVFNQYIQIFEGAKRLSKYFMVEVD